MSVFGRSKMEHITGRDLIHFAAGPALALLMAVPNVFAAAPSAEKVAEIEAYLERVMALGEIPGLAVSVYHDGKPVIERGYGYANLEWQVPMTSDAVFEIASVSKTFTAMAIAQLIDKGVLSLDDTLGQYVPQAEIVADVSLSRMLSHTSGMGSFNFDQDYKKFATRLDLTPDEFLPLILEKSKPLFEAGEAIYYSNTAVWYLSYIIERVSDLSYGEFLQKHIFGPFSMTGSAFNDYGRLIPKRVSGYVVSPEDRKNAIGRDAPAIPYGAGALVSTAGDLQRYMYELHAGNKVSKKVREIMFGTSHLNDGRTTFYTTGLLIHGSYHGHPRYEHAGTIDGFTAMHAYFPEQKIGIVVLSNANATNNPVTLIEITIANLLLDIELPKKQALEEGAAATHSGIYRLTETSEYFGDFQIAEEDGKLVLKLGGLMMKDAATPPMELSSAGENMLIAELWGGVLTYVLEFEPSSARGTISSNGLNYSFERVNGGQ